MLDNGYGNNLSAADVGAVVGNNRGFGGGDGIWWLIVIVILAFMGNGGFGNGGNFMPGLDLATQSGVQRGFDQSAMMNGINSIQAQTNDSFQNLQQQINTMAMNQQNCCCETKQAIGDLKYNLAVEACNDRAAVANALKDLTAFVGAEVQSLKDDFCNYRIEQKDETIAQLRNQINMMNLNASQNQQTLELKADNAAQTTALEQYLAPVARPAYIVPNPNCCQNVFSGFGCNGQF